jgi:hypothetical protein
MANLTRRTTSQPEKPPARGIVPRRFRGICAALLLGFLVSLPVGAFADKIVHNDGTTVEGKITAESPDEIHIETRFGPLRFPKTDLAKIERDAPPQAAATPTPAGPVLDYSTVIPRGPVNPESPPQLPDISEMARRGIPPPPEQTAATMQTGAVAPKGTPAADAPQAAGSFERAPAGATVTRGAAAMPATAQLKLAPGDRVATANSGASIVLADGSRVKLPPSSVVEIPGPGSPVLLISGSVWGAANQSAPRPLEVRAGDASASADSRASGSSAVFRVALGAAGRVRLSCLSGQATMRWAKGDAAMPVAEGNSVELDTKTGLFGGLSANESMFQIEWRSL